MEQRKLSNGTRVVIENIDYVKSAAVGIFFKAGAVDENGSNSGISHFIEHMMFKGTDKRTAKKIAEDVDMIGGSINAFTGKESTCYYIKTISENLEQGVEILADMINNSLFDEKEIEKEKQVVLEEMKMVEDTPDELSIDLISETVLKGMSTGNSIIGRKETVSSITAEEIREYLKSYYSAENMVISVAGNVDIDKTIEIMEKYFSKIAGNKTDRPYKDFLYTPNYVYRNRDIEQTHIALGTKGLSYEDKDNYVLNIYSNILGGSMSSRLFQKVREEKGLAYSVQAFASSYVDNGYFAIYAGVGHDKAHDAVEAIREELKKLKEEGVSDYELKMTKEQIKGNYIFGQENTNKRMFTAGRNILLYNKHISDNEILDKVEKVNKDDIMRIAEMYCELDDYSAVFLSRENIDPKASIKGK